MPVEIRELHIRLNVAASPAGPAAPQPAGGAKDKEGRRGAVDDLVARCVEEVMEVLRSKEER